MRSYLRTPESMEDVVATRQAYEYNWAFHIARETKKIGNKCCLTNAEWMSWDQEDVLMNTDHTRHPVSVSGIASKLYSHESK